MSSALRSSRPPASGSSDPSALLAALKVDREAPPKHRRTRWLPLAIAVVAAAITGAAAGYLAFRPPPPEALTSAADAAQADTTASAPPGWAPAPAPAPAPDSSVLDATGYVVARRQATVSAKTTGKVSEILVEEGMHVQEGDIIARLDDSVAKAELELARAELAAAGAAIDELDVEIGHASRMTERTRSLAARALVSEADLDARALAEATLRARRRRVLSQVTVAQRRLDVQRRHLADLEIRAPFAGVVVDKAAQPGEMVSPISAGGGFTRTGLGTIVDMTSLEVEVDVNEAYINRVHPGQSVTVTLNAYPERPYDAEVLTVIPTADRTRGTVAVRVRLLAPDRRVLPDMGVSVAFLESTSTKENADESHGPL